MDHVDTVQRIKVLCADDHPIVRKGIASLLANESDIVLVAEASGGKEAVDLFRLHRPGCDPHGSAHAGYGRHRRHRIIREEFPEAKIIALTSYDGDQDIYQALEAGVRGYLLKEMVHTEVLRAIRTFIPASGSCRERSPSALTNTSPQIALTPREVEVLSMRRRGYGEQRHRGQARHGERHRSRCTCRTFSENWVRRTGRMRSRSPSGGAFST